jgi:hypothetical protein
MSWGGAMPGGQEDPGSGVRQDIHAARDAYVAGHDLTVHNYYAAERTPYRVDDFDLGRPVVPVEQARERPSRLLQVRYELVDFVGREPQLDELTSWRDSPQTSSVLLVHGSAGQGKSRLALHFARICSAAGWKVQSARHAGDFVAPADSSTPDTFVPSQDPASTSEFGILLVVDYAERWPLTDLLELISDASGPAGQRLRVLLLARPAGSWWQGLSYRIDKMGIGTRLLPLPPLADQVERQRIFDTACEHFAAALGAQDIGPLPAVDRGLDAGVVLAVHMGALSAVDARRRNVTPPYDLTEVSAYLLTRERDHWQRLHDQGRIQVSPDAMAQTSYVAALTGSLKYQDSLSAIKRARIGTNEHPDRIVKDHMLAYPPPAGGHQADPPVLQPLYPDRLAEDFLALSTPGHASSYQSDPWAVTAPIRLMTAAKTGEPPPWSRHALTTLIETARRWPHIETGELYPLLRKHPKLVLTLTDAALTALAELPGLDLSTLERIEAQLPDQSYADLDMGIATITKRLTTQQLTFTHDPVSRAHLYNRLGSRMTNAGQYRQALDAADEAVTIFRRLIKSDRRTYEFYFAQALSNRGACLFNADHREEAIPVTRQAITIYRRLVKAGEFKESSLAVPLANLANQLHSLGRYGDALSASRQAIGIYRRLTKTEQAIDEAHFAWTLLNYADYLSHASRDNEGLAAVTESVIIYQRLAEANPAAYDSAFARSLTTLGTWLSGADQHEDALSVASHAAAIYRRHADANPTTFGPRLADSLHDILVRMSKIGRLEDGVSAFAESVTIYRHLAEADPAAFEPSLAESLDDLGIHLRDAGHLEDALATTEEAIAIYRQLAETNPATSKQNLAKSLDHLGIYLKEAGRLEDGLAVGEEAIAIHRHLAATNPTASRRDLAKSLDSMRIHLRGAGRLEDALAAGEEAIAIYRQLAATDPATFEPNLAGSLHDLVPLLSELGQREDAVIAADQAAIIYRRLAKTHPAAFGADLVRVLHNLYACLWAVDRREDAFAAAAEAATTYRVLTETDPAAFEPGLAETLRDLASILSSLDRGGDALAAADEATTIYRRLTGTNPIAFEPNLAASLTSLCTHLSYLDREADALIAADEAISIYRRLAETDPAAFEPDLAEFLYYCGNLAGELGRQEEALAATYEATTIYRRLAENDPAEFEPGLAKSLYNLHYYSEALGYGEDALAAAEEAITVYRLLVETNPAEFEPGLARSLGDLPAHLPYPDRQEDALAALEEAATIYWRLAATNPAEFEADLATSLVRLSNSLSYVDRQEDAAALRGDRQAAHARLWQHLGQLLLASQSTGPYTTAGTSELGPLQRSAALLDGGDLDQALAWACLARAADPGPGALFMGQIQTRRGEPGQARNALAVAAEQIEPGRLSEVLAAYDSLISTQPADPWLYAEHADALNRAGQSGDALAAWNRALTLAPDNPSLHFNKAQLLFGLSRFKEAQPELLAVIRLRPGDTLGAAVLLAAIIWPADTSRARQHFQAGLASPGKTLTPFTRAFYRAVALTGLDQLEDAIGELQAVAPSRTSQKPSLDNADTVLLNRFRNPPLHGLEQIMQFFEP